MDDSAKGHTATAFVVTLDSENADELEAKEKRKIAALRKLEEKRKAAQAAKLAAAIDAAEAAAGEGGGGGGNSGGDGGGGGPGDRESTPTLTSELPPEMAGCALLSDSATYLINRMLESDQQEPSSLESEGADVVSTVLTSKLTKDDPEDSGVCEDSRSETGTYTLAVEHKNVDVEHARQMIDVVFGVSDRNRCNMSSGTVPESTEYTSRETEKSLASAPACYPDTGADVEMLRELRQRTFTRADSRRSSEDKSITKQSTPTVTNSAARHHPEPLIKPSIEHQIKSVFHSERMRHDSAGSSRTVEIKAPTVLRKPPASASNSPFLQRKNLGRFSSSACSTPRPGSTESLTGSFDSDPISTGSGLQSKNNTTSDNTCNSPLKLNRAFALRRARLGIETPGVPLNLTEEKQKKNLENKNRISPGNRYGLQSTATESTYNRSNSNHESSSNFNRRDGGRFSLRAPSSRNSTPVRSAASKPPIPSSSTHGTPEKRNSDFRKQATPTHSRPGSNNRQTTPVLSSGRNLRASSESKTFGQNQRISPASSTCSVSHCQSVQRSCSFGPAPNVNAASHGMSPRGSLDYSTQLLRGMSPLRLTKRMFNSKAHQMASDARNSHRQQANVVPIKRSPSDAAYSFEPSSPTPNHHCTSLPQKVILSPQSNSAVNCGAVYHSLQSNMTRSIHESDSLAASAPSPGPTATPTYPSQSQPAGGSLTRSGRSLSALDTLVLAAILQLSMKLRNGMKELLHQERIKHPPGSETRMMIDEILPQVASLESLTCQPTIESMVHENLSKDLSSILKNLKRVEQSIEGK